MKTILLSAIVLTQITVNAQVLTKFSWAGPTANRLSADVGPSAVSIGSTATVALVSGTSNYALSPGTGSNDINLTLPNTTYYDVPSLDFSIDFRREESDASFLTRSTIFDFGMSGGKLFVKFTLLNPNGTTNQISSGSIYNIPDDHKFHTYRFVYDHMTGVANVWVDGVAVYNYVGKGGWSLSWKNAGAPVIGRLMDATGRNVPVIDNVDMRVFTMALILPVNFVSFQVAETASGTVSLHWNTANEVSVKTFNVERSNDGINFKTISQVTPARSNSPANQYNAVDLIAAGLSYYRIAAVSFDGTVDYTEVRKISPGVDRNTGFKAFPNPATHQLTITLPTTVSGKYTYQIFTQDGRLVQTGSEGNVQNALLNLKFGAAVPRNAMLTIILSTATNEKESVRVYRN